MFKDDVIEGMLTIKMTVTLPTTTPRRKRVVLAKSWCGRDDVNDELKILLIVKDLLHSNYNNVLLREIANNIIGSIKRHGDNGDNTKKNGLYRNILLLLLDKE